MIFRDSCYFCTSTYQLFPIISLAIHRNETADLYIDPDFDGAFKYADRIRNLKIFCNVVVIKIKFNYNTYYAVNDSLLYKIQTAFSYLKVDEIAKKILIHDVRYTNMFVSSNAYFPRIVHFHFIKNRIPTEIKYIEDGIGSYLGNHAYTTILPERLLRRVLFGKEATSFAHERFLFSPELFQTLNKNSNVTVRRIPKIWKEKKYKKLFNTVFLESEKVHFKERVMILDQPKYEIFSNDNIKNLIEIYKLIIDIVGEENIIVKRHPRCKDNKIESLKYYLDSGIPFECICMNTDMNNKILISFESTAVVTPKVLFNQEPVVILLYKLIETKPGGYDLAFEEEFFSTVKKTYFNKSKFYIPNGIDELKSILYGLF